MPPHIPQHIVTEALRALRNKEVRVEIARRLKVSPQWVSKLAAAHGIESVHRSAADQIRQGTYHIGARTVASFIMSLPDEVIQWVHVSRPEGSTFAETLRAIIIDAYHDENPPTEE